MKAIAIKKFSTNREKDHIIFVADTYTEEDIEEAVKYWAEYQDGGGHANGSRLEWNETKDKKSILLALVGRRKQVSDQISSLSRLSVELEDYQNLLEYIPHLTLKFGRIKSGDYDGSPEAFEISNSYDWQTPEEEYKKKECEVIDAYKGRIFAWYQNEFISKKEAKKYIMSYTPESKSC